MQTLDLLRKNLEILLHAVHNEAGSSLIEEAGKPDADNYYAVYELNDELFLFHFSRLTICRLIVFENVPAALNYLRTALHTV
jgi:hypothetical protein